MKLHPYQTNFSTQFKNRKAKILKSIGNFEIHHIGSTAIPNLPGKGIIDIMISLDKWSKADQVIRNLKKIGFNHVHPKENGRIFLSKQPKTKFGDTHLHLVKKGTRPHNEFLAFRNYLIENKVEKNHYLRLKKKLLKVTEGNRAKYTKGKNEYMKSIIKKSLKK